MNKKIQVGDVFSSNKYGDFKIIEKCPEYKFKIKFLLTGYEKIAMRSCVLQGEIRDPYYPIYYDVACVGNIKGKTSDYKKEFSLWRGILKRCYSFEERRTISYHRKNVTICKRWLCFEYFLEDIKNIEGYNEKLFMEGKLQLDKDKKTENKSNIEYSLENCCFVTVRENLDIRNKNTKKHTSSKYLGVTKLNKINKYQVTVVYKGRNYYGGRFDSELDAQRAYETLKNDILNNPDKYINRPKNNSNKKKYIAVYKNSELLNVFYGLSDLSENSIKLFGTYLRKENVSHACLKNIKYKSFSFKYINKKEYERIVGEDNA